VRNQGAFMSILLRFCDELTNLFLKSNATTAVPIKVAVQYSHKFVKTPDNTVGASERAGFIDAPEINAKKNMSRPTIPPITIPLKPFRPLVYTTVKITAIKRAEASISIPNMNAEDMHSLER
jgi:hypothetical protein